MMREIDDCSSDGGEETFPLQDSSDSDASTEEEDSVSDEEESRSPPQKKPRHCESSNPTAQSVVDKDGAVWIRQADHLSARELDQPACCVKGEPTLYAKRNITSRLQSFLCLIDTSMLQTITQCTTIEAKRTDPKWSLRVSELKAFISILFTKAATTKIEAVKEAWSEHLYVPAIAETMPRDRFLEIMKHLRFDDKDTRPARASHDKFAAISDIWHRFIANCVMSYKPGQHITVDEQLFPTKVRCPFFQYSKPKKFGIKFWIAADLETNFMCNAIPCLGKESTCPEEPESIVMRLMEPLMDVGRTVTTNSYFTSLSLANRLLQRNTTLLGPMNKVRWKIPGASSGCQQFSTQVFTSGSALLTVYVPHKNKPVCILSTMHHKVDIDTNKKKKPNTVTAYKELKCGVDVMEQKARAYTVRAATQRWPVAVFYNTLDLAAMNAHVLYKACTGSTEKMQLFLAQLAQELRQEHEEEKARGKRGKRLRIAETARASGKSTQCQVLKKCNRNHSTEKCCLCDKYTCRKCRKDTPWVCVDC